MKNVMDWACPCRLTEGKKEIDLDILCPCDYRDPDLNDYGTCFCGLYVTAEIVKGKKKVKPIPEQRPTSEGRNKTNHHSSTSAEKLGSLNYPVWRCKVCGYLCARDGPPEVCPICKTRRERFEMFIPFSIRMQCQCRNRNPENLFRRVTNYSKKKFLHLFPVLVVGSSSFSTSSAGNIFFFIIICFNGTPV